LGCNGRTLAPRPPVAATNSKGPGSSSGGGDSSSGSGGDIFDGHSADQRSSLKVGERLEGELYNKFLRAALSVSRTDGSILFSTPADSTPRDEHGGNIGPMPRATEILIQSDAATVKKVRQIRREIAEEAKEAESRAKSGEGRKKGVVAGVKRRMPFGKGGWLRRRARAHAKAHLGEVTMTVTNRGVVVSTIDLY